MLGSDPSRMSGHRIDLDDLIHAYIRFKEWMGYDLTRSNNRLPVDYKRRGKMARSA